MAKKEEVKQLHQKKFTYEELTNIAQKAVSDLNLANAKIQQLVERINELSAFAASKSMDYGFKVLENADKFPASFVEQVKTEIMNVLIAKEEPKEEPKQEQENIGTDGKQD